MLREKRDSRLTADISETAHDLLKAAVEEFDSSKGKLVEKMIHKYLGSKEAAPATQVAVVKKTKATPVEMIYPENLNVGAWELWVAFRKKAKFAKYKTDATMLKLSKMGNQGEQMLIVQNSIDCQYQGLFALKANNSAATKTSGNLSACEDFING